jgi:hypothetical protein
MDTRPIRRIEIVVAALLVVSLLLEACGAAPSSETVNSRKDARMLLLAIHGIAVGEEDAEDAGLGPRGTGVWLRPTFLPEAGPIDEVKAAIRDLEAECAQERAAIQDTPPEADTGEAIAALDDVCRAELAQLQQVLNDLWARRSRGSWWKRTFAGKVLAGAWKFTKQTVKRSASTVLLAVISGGGGVVVKHILIGRGRADLEREARRFLGRALARKGVGPPLLDLVGLSPGRWPPAETTAEQAETLPSESSSEPAEPSPTEAGEGYVITADVTEQHMTSPSFAVLTWILMDEDVGVTSGWCKGIDATTVATKLNVQLQIDLMDGTAEGVFSGTFACPKGDSDCDDPGEFATGSLEGAIVDGWARPDGKGGWEWGGTVKAKASMSAKRLCIRIDSPDFPSTYIWAEGSTSRDIDGFLSGNSWGFPGGSEGVWFSLGGPDEYQWGSKPHLNFAIDCLRPSCPLPRSVPPPP